VGGFALVATTAESGTPTSATGDLPSSLPLGEYEVTAVPALAGVTGSWRLTGFACDAGPGSPPVGVDGAGSVTVALTPEAPRRTCTASYARLAATRLDLVWAAATGDGATATGSPALDVACADGAHGRLVRGAAGTESSLPQPLYFSAPTTCEVTVAGGVPAGLSVTVAGERRPPQDVNAQGGPSEGAPPDTPAEVAVTGLPAHVEVALSMAVVTVTVLDAPPAASSAPPVVVGGSFPVPPMALVGAGVVLAGAFLLLLVVVRARRRDPAG
jgi:hypothetical protein